MDCRLATCTGSCGTRSTSPTLIMVGGFLTAYLFWWNGLVALIWLGVQIARIRHEEVLLSNDERYQRYAQEVRWRLVPGVW